MCGRSTSLLSPELLIWQVIKTMLIAGLMKTINLPERALSSYLAEADVSQIGAKQKLARLLVELRQALSTI